jgi:hypothetical protein
MKRLVQRTTFSERALRQKRRGKQPDWDAVNAKSARASAWIAFVSAVISLVLLYLGIRTLKYTADQIRDVREQAQTEHLIKKTEEFNSPEFRATRKALATKRLNRLQDTLIKMTPDSAPDEMFDALSFCNDLGILMKHGQISAYDVWADFSFWLIPVYADAASVIQADQKDAPASWSNCDSLMEQVKKVDQQEDAGKQLGITADDIAGFYSSEIEENDRTKR